MPVALALALALFLLFASALPSIPAGGLQAQEVEWSDPEGSVVLAFPAGWEQWDGSAPMRVSTLANSEVLPGARFQRRAGGGMFRRSSLLTASVYRVPDAGLRGESVAEAGDAIRREIERSYALIDTYPVPELDVVSYAYRYLDSGDALTQGVIVFGDARGRLYLLEVSAHRRDEALLLEELRKLAHSIGGS